MKNNILIFGDNLVGMRHLIDVYKLGGKVDLVYTDPPFATNCRFSVSDGRASTVSVARNGKTAYTDFLLGNDFVSFIRERAVLIRELLSDQGSLYLHTDYKIGHYLKVMLDGVFGVKNFRNDITRIKCSPKNFNRVGYGNVKDMVLFYSKGKDPIWNEPREAYAPEDVEKLFPKIDENGRRYTTVPVHAPGETLHPERFKGLLPPAGRHWRTDVKIMERWDRDGLIEWSKTGNPRKKIFADEREGKRVQDVWTGFKDPMYPIYPTEKNSDMVDRIVKTSSNKGSIVLDCFCGSGSTLLVAERNARRWIGVDSSEVAIKTVRDRLGICNKTLIRREDVEFVDVRGV